MTNPMSNLRTVKINNEGEAEEITGAVSEAVQDMIVRAPGTPLEKAVAQAIYMLNFLRHSKQISDGGFELMVQGISNVCKSMENMTPERMNELVELFENANMMAHTGVTQQ